MLPFHFFEHCLTIPVEKRYNHQIYFKWILKKYPDAANYDWERLHSNIKDIKSSGDYQKALKSTGRDIDSKNHMNPLAYWYKTNNDVKIYMDNYYNENISGLKFDKDLYQDCVKRYEQGNYIGKAKVLTLLATLKIYFS